MDSAGRNKKGNSIPPRSTIRTRRQVAAEKRKAEEELMRAEEEKRSKSLFAPRGDGSIGSRDMLIGQEDPVEVKVEVKLEDLEGEEGQVNCDGGFEGFEQIGKIEENVVTVKYEEMIDESEGATAGEHLVEECFNLDEEDIVAGREGIFGVEEEIPEEIITVEEVLSHVFPLLKQKDVFQCRLVSKQWRGMVDDFINKLVVPEHYDDEAYLKKMERSPKQVCPLPKFRNVEYAYHFRCERVLEYFNERMAAHVDLELSPFVGGATVTLDQLFVESSAPLLTPALKKFLEEFGKHIQNLVIIPTVFDVVRFVECLKLCLHFVPNLERLKLAGTYPIVRNRREIDKIWLEICRNDLQSRMPKLNELTSLELEFSNTKDKDYRESHHTLRYLDEIFYDLMIKPFYQTQLKNLQIVGSPVRNGILKMCNLKELTLKVSTSEPKKILEDKWLEAPVEKLNLIICKLTRFKFSTDADVFNILQIFPLVRYLKIENFDLIAPIFGTIYAKSSIPANNIHTLELTKLDKCDSISDAFFQSFPKLRFLIIRDTNFYGRNDLEKELRNGPTVPENETGGLKISKLFYGGTTYDTSVWQLVPALEVFTFQFQSHPSPYKWCDCKVRTKYQCPFKNIVETRLGYQMYQDRLSRIPGEN